MVMADGKDLEGDCCELVTGSLHINNHQQVAMASRKKVSLAISDAPSESKLSTKSE